MAFTSQHCIFINASFITNLFYFSLSLKMQIYEFQMLFSTLLQHFN